VQPLMGWPPGCLLVHLFSEVTRLESALAVHVSCMQLTPGTWPSRVVSFQWLYCVTPKCVIHSTRMDTRDLGFSFTDNWYVSGIHLSWSSSVVRVPMSDLFTLLSGTLVHPDDRCLTTLRFLSAHTSRDTSPRCSWDLALHGPYITSGQRRPRTGRYTTQTTYLESNKAFHKRLIFCSYYLEVLCWKLVSL